MDIDSDLNNGELVPISPIQFKEAVADSIDIVPVIFIVNNSLLNRTNKELETLALKVYNYTIAKVKQAGKQNFKEIQIDCDWSRKTTDQYFFFLAELKKHLQPSHELSVTLRLHQYKNHHFGIPPVDRVTLMCYNMGNLRKYGEHNSILELDEMEKYLSTDEVYPIPLNIALPLFHWSVVFRQEQYVGISRIPQSKLKDSSMFKIVSLNGFTALSDVPEYGLLKNDYIRFEDIPREKLSQASNSLKKHLKLKDSLTIIFYHLDETLINQYNNEELEKVTHHFN